MPYGIEDLGQYLIRLVACVVPSHYLNQYWFIVVEALETNFGDILTNTKIFSKKMHSFGNVHLQNDNHFVQTSKCYLPYLHMVKSFCTNLVTVNIMYNDIQSFIMLKDLFYFNNNFYNMMLGNISIVWHLMECSIWVPWWIIERKESSGNYCHWVEVCLEVSILQSTRHDSHARLCNLIMQVIKPPSWLHCQKGFLRAWITKINK